MGLTERELECLKGIADGLKVDAVGHSLGIHKKTVEKHLASTRRKMKASSTVHAIAMAIQFGWFKVEK